MGRKRKRELASFIEQEDVINRPWIDVKGLSILLPVGDTTLSNIMKTIKQEMDIQGEFYFKTKPALIPTKKVVEKYDIDVDFIRKEANKQRKYGCA